MSAPSQSLDSSGLPAPVADEPRKLAEAIKDGLDRGPSPRQTPADEPPDRKAARLRAWVGSHPARAIDLADDRESVYAGRGE